MTMPTDEIRRERQRENTRARRTSYIMIAAVLGGIWLDWSQHNRSAADRAMIHAQNERSIRERAELFEMMRAANAERAELKGRVERLERAAGATAMKDADAGDREP